MEGLNSEPILSPKTIEISQKIKLKAATSFDIDQIKRPDGSKREKEEGLALNDYVEAVHEFLERDEVLSDDLLKQRIDYLLQDSRLKDHFREGKRCCAVVIPCTPGGSALTLEEIDEGMHFHNLILDANDMTLSGFTLEQSAIFKLMPKEIQEQLTFDIGKYDTENLADVTPGDRQRIIAEYERVFRNAQKIFNVGNLNTH